MNAQECWEKALPFIEKSVTEVIFTSIILPLKPLSLENNVLTLMTGSFFQDTITRRYLFEINRCVHAATGLSIETQILSPEDLDGTKEKNNKEYQKTNLIKKFTFDTFVKGKSNELAYAAALAVAETPGKTDYNPLFLYGGVGLGKTHLLHSIGNMVMELHPDMKVIYQSTETFTNQLIAGIREKSTQNFKEKYRSCDVLLLDDIQFLKRTVETQEEMFHTFNALHNDSKQIVITSDLPPKELSDIEKRLTTRFSQGLIVDVTMPDYETRIAILEHKLALERLVIPNEVKEFIIRNVVSNIRDLEGALNKITAFAKFTGVEITLESAEKALKDQIDAQEKPPLTIQYIIEVVASYYNLRPEDLRGRKRTKNIVLPRQIAMYLARKILDASLPQIGRDFDGRDHTTAMHSCEKVSGLIESDPRIREVILELEKKVQK